MALKDLNEKEVTIYMWQKGMMGGFYTRLMELITMADNQHLDLIELGFPFYVSAYKKFAHEPGWWQNVERIAEEK